MENPNKSSNTGIVIAILCLVIGVVLGAMLMSNKVPTGTQEGAALKSPVAEKSSSTTGIDTTVRGTTVTNPVFVAGEFKKKIPGTYTLNFCAVSTATCPGYGQTITIEALGGGGAGDNGQSEGGINDPNFVAAVTGLLGGFQLEVDSGGWGGSGGGAGGYIFGKYTIPSNGSVRSMTIVVGNGGTHGTFLNSPNSSGVATTIVLKNAAGGTVATASAGRGSGPGSLTGGVSGSGSFTGTGFFSTVVKAANAGMDANPTTSCTGGSGAAGANAPTTLSQKLGYIGNAGQGGAGGHGGYNNQFPACTAHGNDYGKTDGINGNAGVAIVTWQ